MVGYEEKQFFLVRIKLSLDISKMSFSFWKPLTDFMKFYIFLHPGFSSRPFSP